MIYKNIILVLMVVSCQLSFSVSPETPKQIVSRRGTVRPLKRPGRSVAPKRSNDTAIQVCGCCRDLACTCVEPVVCCYVWYVLSGWLNAPEQQLLHFPCVSCALGLMR